MLLWKLVVLLLTNICFKKLTSHNFRDRQIKSCKHTKTFLNLRITKWYSLNTYICCQKLIYVLLNALYLKLENYIFLVYRNLFIGLIFGQFICFNLHLHENLQTAAMTFTLLFQMIMNNFNIIISDNNVLKRTFHFFVSDSLPPSVYTRHEINVILVR